MKSQEIYLDFAPEGQTHETMANVSLDQTVLSPSQEDKTLIDAYGVIYSPDGKSLVGVLPDARPQLRTYSIREGIVRITPHAFERCTRLEELNFPTTLRSIGQQAFADCWSLTEVILPKGTYKIEARAFVDCHGLRQFEAEGLREIGVAAFAKCWSLKHIDIPFAVEALPAVCFYRCIALSSVRLKGWVVGIHPKAFLGCRELRSITAPRLLDLETLLCKSLKRQLALGYEW